MHISEGVLGSKELVAGAIIGVALLVYAYKKTDFEQLQKVAFFSALFFLFSFIHIPLGPTSIHLSGIGVVGLMLGFGSPLAIFVALVLQALLFGYGGVSVLGVNLVIMALPAIIVYTMFRNATKHLYLVYFSVGFTGVFLASILLCVTLWINGEAFRHIARLIFVANLPLAIIEGVVTLFLLKFLSKTSMLKSE